MSKQIAMIGLGKMGNRMATRLLERGYEVVCYDVAPETVKAMAEKGMIAVTLLADLATHMLTPRVVWLMVPATGAVDDVLHGLLKCGITSEDLIVDGGNSNFRDTIRRAEMLDKRGIFYVDAGTSGGLQAVETGFSFAVGGTPDAYQRLEPVLDALAAPGGYAHVGPSGSGHFVKMAHNAIEYGIMAALGEGFELLASGPYPSLDLECIAHVWNHGGILRSYLLELAERVFHADPRLTGLSDHVEDTGLARLAVQEAISHDVPFHSICDALFARMRSRQETSFAAKVVAGLRREFGGHAVGSPQDS